MKREQIIEIFERMFDCKTGDNWAMKASIEYFLETGNMTGGFRMKFKEFIDAILALKPIEQPYIPLDQYGYPLTTANNQTEVKRVEEKPTDEDIVASIPYPNPISKHQSDINIGWIKCRKAMRDNPEQFKDK